MIELIQQRFHEDMTLNDKMNVTREFMQILTLKMMSDKNIFEHIAFVGGTSLRILFKLRRFSEDLDFSLLPKGDFAISSLDDQLRRSFSLYGLELETKVKAEGNVQSIMMKFPGLLKELGLSALARQKLSIKVEIDLNPPQGWKVVHGIVYDVYMFSIVHYDLPSMFAGKLHACLFRTYTKGRDLYDFIWFLGKNILPNFALLNHAIQQTQGTSIEINSGNIREILLDYVQNIDLTKAKEDVKRFLEDPSELSLFNREILIDTINSIYSFSGQE